MSRALPLFLACLQAAVGLPACRRSPAPSTQPTTQPSTAPAVTPTSAPATQPVDPNAPLRVEVKSAEDEQNGWLRIEKLDEKVEGGWASGHRPEPNRIVVETENVNQFSIDLSQLEIDWSGRVWMRINRYAFELAHKRHPLVHFRESRAGVWEIVEVHDAP